MGDRLKKSFPPQMWQRIFFAILLLVLLAQLTPLVIVYMEMPTLEEHRKTEVNYFCEAIAANLDGRELSDAHMYMDLFNKAGPEIWFEQGDGEVLAGIPVPGFTAREREDLPSVSSPRPGARVWRGKGTWNYQADLPLDLLAVGVTFKDAGPATMFIIYPNYRLPKISGDTYLALAILILAGALISYAVSRHLSAPLRRLQKEVLAIDEKSLGRPISTAGTREVAAVAGAVNHLTETLGRYTRNMTELVANISHELRSPLARMEGHVEFIEEGFDRASRQVETARDRLAASGAPLPPDAAWEKDMKAIHLGLRHLTLLKEEIGHMDNLVGTTLLSSRLDLNGTPPPFHPVDLAELCRETLRRRRLFIGNRGIDLNCRIAEKAIIPGDRTLLHQMISNLVDNAAQYVTERGRIDIHLTGQEDNIRFEIENTHPPFPEKELDRLFDPFFRAGRATGTGAGLGLSLVKKIADIHRATVSATNTETGLRLEAVFPF